MAKLNKYQAHKVTGRSRNTIDKYIKDGKLSAEVDEHGSTVIDTSELTRVFGEFKPKDDRTRTEHSPKSVESTVEDMSSKAEIEQLKLTIAHKDELMNLKVEAKERELAIKEREIDELRRMNEEYRDNWRRTLTLIEAPANSDTKPMGFWKTLFQKVAN
jgi:predicted site-specific integrase-resolvase